LIYHNLKAAMTSAGITQKTIAQTMGVRESTVTDWFSGKHSIKLETALEMRDRLFPDEGIEDLFARQ
jgi:transcriptional regulator with XRE-family HTH domain